MSNIDQMSPSMKEALQRNWSWLLVLGIFFVVLGFIGLGMVVSVTMASMLLIGILLLIAGVLQVVDTFRSKHWKAAIWHLLIAILYIFASSLVIYDPILASVIITALLAYTLIIIGITRSIMAFSIRHEAGWFWLLLAGIAALVLGIMILMQWPLSGLWVIGMLICIEMIISGWCYIFLALAGRNS